MQHVHTEDKLYVTVISERSGTRDDEKTTARCPQGYLLAGCEIHGSAPDGLKIADDEPHGCVAYNGHRRDADGVIVSHRVDLFQARY